MKTLLTLNFKCNRLGSLNILQKISKGMKVLIPNIQIKMRVLHKQFLFILKMTSIQKLITLLKIILTGNNNNSIL
jgi:hypothetical protein